jgi:hypothetical protein
MFAIHIHHEVQLGQLILVYWSSSDRTLGIVSSFAKVMYAQQDARDVSEGYIAKSNPYILMVSTPNAPDGLFEQIEKESEDTCLYKRIFLDYTYGIGKMYTAEEIEKAKASPSFEHEYSPSFEHEYNLKYLGKIGNVFHTKDIEAAIEKGRKYNPDNFNPRTF